MDTITQLTLIFAFIACLMAVIYMVCVFTRYLYDWFDARRTVRQAKQAEYDRAEKEYKLYWGEIDGKENETD